MKSNRKAIARKDDHAEVGVGTLIVFIAMVLVAAVAAAVLISTSGSLQQRAQQTGKEATQEVSSNMKILNVYGVRNTTAVNVYWLRFNMALSAGALPMDLQKLVIRYSDGQNTRVYSYSSAPTFTLSWIRGAGTNDVMKAGDLVQVQIDMVGSTLAPRSDVQISFIPETGSPIPADIRTPSSYGSDVILTIS